MTTLFRAFCDLYISLLIAICLFTFFFICLFKYLPCMTLCVPLKPLFNLKLIEMFTRRDVFYSLPVKYLIRRSIWIYICTIKFNKKFKLFDLTSLKIFFLLPFLSEPIYSLMLPSLFFIHRIISGYERYKSSLITNLIWCHPWNNIFRRTKKFSKFCYAQITCHFVSSSWWGCITWFKGPCCHLKRDRPDSHSTL